MTIVSECNNFHMTIVSECYNFVMSMMIPLKNKTTEFLILCRHMCCNKRSDTEQNTILIIITTY